MRHADTIRLRVKVEENAVLVAGLVHVEAPKTPRSRSVPYPEFLALPIAKLAEGKARDDLLFGDGKIYVKLPASRNGWFTSTVARVRAADKTFPRITPHDLRHTAASLAVEAGAHVKAVQRMLGHASATMTLDTYADLFDDDLDAVPAAFGHRPNSSHAEEASMKHVAPPGTLAESYLPDLRHLSADQRITFRIGLMTRLTVTMERTARDVHGWLQERDNPAELQNGPRPFATLIREIKESLRPVDEDFAPAAREALDEIYAAYEERNRFVHDVLYETDPGQWSRESLEFQTPRHRRTVNEDTLIEAVLSIVRANWRLDALAWLVSRPHQDRTAPSMTNDPEDPYGWKPILENRFVLTPSGGASTTPDAHSA